MNKNKSIEEIENQYWPEYKYETNLIKICHELRRVKLMDLTLGNIRMLLGQNIGNKIVVPLAIEHLEKNILCEAEFYEGDLFLTILKIEKKFWEENPEIYKKMYTLVSEKEDVINQLQLTE